MHIPPEPLYKRFIRPFTSRPYTPREGLGVLWRNLVGADARNEADVHFAPRRNVLNAIDPRVSVGFGGDVMSMFERPLRIDPSVRDFWAPCDHVLLNFEGVITAEPQIAPDQKHTRPILDSLLQAAPAERLVLSLANNHTGDYGEPTCRYTLDLLRERGFRCFGIQDCPSIDLGDDIRVITGTQWSNRTGHHLAWLKGPEQHRRAGAFNLLYPHWGFELELYPRPSLVDQMQHWLTQFDAVIGHHSHTPQPLTVHTPAMGPRQVAAYSLGDFCFGMAFDRFTLKYYIWGLIGRMTLGPLHADPTRWAVGELEWSFIECRQPTGQDGFVVRTVDQIPLFPSVPLAA